MYPEIQPFSAAYDQISVTVVPSDDELPRMQEALSDDLVYWMSGIEQNADVPMIFRYPSYEGYFEVKPTSGIPIDTVELPETLIQAFQLDRLPATESFLIAKPEYARTLKNLV